MPLKIIGVYKNRKNQAIPELCKLLHSNKKHNWQFLTDINFRAAASKTYQNTTVKSPYIWDPIKQSQ